MPETLKTTIIAVIDGQNYPQTITDSGSSVLRASPTVPGAKVGALTTHTSGSVGTLTMNAGHGFGTGNKLDLYWDGGSRLQCTAGTVSGNSVPLTGGSGNNLPAANTPITAMVAVVVPLAFDPSTIAGLGAYSPVIGNVTFLDGSAADIQTATYNLAAGEGSSYTASKGDQSNPLQDVVAVSAVRFSHADTNPQTMRAVAVI